MSKGLSLRTLFLSFLLLLFVLGVGYKVLEWKTLKATSDIYTQVVPEELTSVEKDNKNGLAISDLIGKLYPEKNPPSFEEQLKILDEIDGLTNLAIGYSQEYLNTLERNKKEFEQLSLASKVIFGSRGDYVRKFISNRINYYNEEINAAKQGVVTGYLAKSIFSVTKDKIIMTTFDKKASLSPNTNYSKYFSEIASLEKYTNSGFKYPEEDKIKEYYPYGYDTLINNKNYMSAYYSVVKDFVAGDYESASYKYSRIQENFLKLNVDFDRLFSERDSESNERAKRIIGYVATLIRAVKDFRKNNLGIYPFLPKIDSFKEDLELCQLYNYKTGLFHNTLKKYPNASDSALLIQELSQLPPSTANVDETFDLNTMKFTNTEKTIKFECLDGKSNKTFTFETNK